MAYEIVPCLYNTEKDLQARLHGTICRYDNVPVYVSVISSKEIRLYEPQVMLISRTKEAVPIKAIRPTDELFDISSPEIGYMNYEFATELNPKSYVGEKLPNTLTGNLVAYVQRSPVKQWKQGVYPDAVLWTDIRGKQFNPGVNWTQLFYSNGMVSMIKMEYPAVPVAVHKLSRMHDERWKQIAVSKDVALEKTDSDVIQVHIKRENVGYIIPGERTIHLKKDRNSWISRKYLEGLRASVE